MIPTLFQTQVCILLYVIILILLTSLGGNVSTVLNNARLPTWYPPGYLFGLVWFTLFILFGVFLATAIDTTYQWLGLAFYILTLAWTPIFVYSRSFAVGFYYLFFIWVLTIAFIVYTKSLWLIPQLIWVTIATSLSYSLYRLN
jgi:benzodiazapine receptor